MRKSLFNYSLYSHHEIGNFRVGHHPNIYPSLYISHEALKLVLGETRENRERKWKNK
jgi:hypothetical protein